ncbi:MAG: hypothetical protein ACYDEF_01670 [Methanosarcina sp.]
MADDELIPERDRFIYEVVTDKYKFEWERFSQIEKKATATLGFIGVIFSLETTTGLYILKNIQDGYNIDLFSTASFSLSLLFLLMSIIFGLSAFWTKEWKTVPDIKYFMSEYVDQDKNSTNMIRNLYLIYEEAIAHNHKNNEEKIDNLKYSLRYFAVGILFIFLCLVNPLVVILI